jgi:hypothetical protein
MKIEIQISEAECPVCYRDGVGAQAWHDLIFFH